MREKGRSYVDRLDQAVWKRVSDRDPAEFKIRPRTWVILRQRFDEELQVKDIAAHHGVSHVRVLRILKDAIRKISKKERSL